ncbi:hypothetical protein DH2020_028870 [Rehmannia glutinosa]|uniref:POX domain-containing protein n=1 Tax=Rehmannia glutinosa TaxID=99300 RepID=A0ABR0VQ83_REHGL
MSCMAGPSSDQDKSRDHIIASTGYSYSDASPDGNQFQNFGPGPEIYNMSTTGMENMIGFPISKINNNNMHQQSAFYQQHDFSKHQQQHDLSELLVDDDDDNENDQSLRCVFPCEGNERPSHGLSLSLSSSNPSSIGLQSFELRQNDDNFRFGPSSSRSVNIQPHYSHIRSSRYLGPAQELLNEFCNLGVTTKQTDNKMKVQKDEENSIKTQSFYSLDLLELQRRKTKLLQMLEDVDRRYKHYCDQMKAVISSFEAVAGNGAATAYSALASKAMSRHFRCLKDGILSQIKATKKAMGEKDVSAPGTLKGETPRLRLLDQTLRQQRAIQQMSSMEIHPWRPQRGLPERSVSVSNWFINARVRLWKPMVEEMYLEELKEDEGNLNGVVSANLDENLQNLNPSRNEDDQKPTVDQLVRIDSECLSSIINNNNNNKNDDARKDKAAMEHHQNPSFGYGAMELDFSSYSNHLAGSAAGYGGGGGVSLTLGLHQHGGVSGGGMNLGFSSGTQSSLFYPRDQIEDCQTVPYSLLDGESQNLPYRNLMGAQLLHDLAG